jgi:hypothetical protein
VTESRCGGSARGAPRPNVRDLDDPLLQASGHLIVVGRSTCEMALREAALQRLNVGGMGMLMICTASRLQGRQQFDTTYGRACPEMESRAISCGVHQAGGFDCGRMQVRVR